jgi:plastocyanin
VSGAGAPQLSWAGPRWLSFFLAISTSLAISLATLIGPSRSAAAPASAAGCTWKRHSKPVFKRVRQHRVKRVKHWWTCEAQPSLFQPQPALPVTPTPTTPPGAEPGPEIGHLGVKAIEYSYTLSRPEVDAGEVIVELNNQGEDPHNLVLEHEGSEDPSLEIPATPSVSQASASFTLSPGTYRLYCSLYKHEAKGMEAKLVVAAG